MSESADPWQLLVLEDDPNLRQILTDVLRDEGYEVVAVDNGEAAVQLASQRSFDLVITDIRMDGVDGLQALERARAYQPELSSLVVSGYTSEAETLRALQLNVGGFLKKPFALNDFLQRTRELLQQRGVQQSQRESLLRLRHSLWWAVAAAGGSHQQSAHLALFLARQLALPREECQLIRLAATLAFVESGPLAHWPSSAAQDKLGLAPALQLVQELRRGQALSLSAQVVWLAHGLSQEGAAPDYDWHGSLRPFLNCIPSGPELDTAAAEHEAESGQGGVLARQRSLLGLAVTLEERGDFGSARAAYGRLSEDPAASAETRLQALVGVARAAYGSGGSDWYEVLKEAERASRTLGPLAGAAQRWPIATLLLRSRHASAAAYLAALEGEFQERGLPVLAAKARLGRAFLDGNQEVGGSARLLLGPELLGQVAQDSDWLVAALLACAPRSGLPPGPIWSRLLSEFPQAALLWLKTAEGPALVHLVETLEASPQLAPARLLEALRQHVRPEVRARAVKIGEGEDESTFLRFRSFGDFEVVVNGERVADKLWKTQKFKWMLAYLVARRGQRVHEDVLVDEFWPDARGSGKANVYSATTNMRRCLRANKSEKTDFILRDREMLWFDPDLPCWHDLEEFEAASASQDVQTGRQAAELVSGAYLQGCYLDWAQRRRLQLDEATVALYLRLAQQVSPQESLDYTQRALELDPLCQEGHLLRMGAFLQLGQPERSLKQYALIEKELRRELGIEPLTSLLEAYQRARLALP